MVVAAAPEKPRSTYQEEHEARTLAAQEHGMGPPVSMLLSPADIEAIKATARPGIEIGLELRRARELDPEEAVHQASPMPLEGSAGTMPIGERSRRGSLSETLAAVRDTVAAFAASCGKPTRRKGLVAPPHDPQGHLSPHPRGATVYPAPHYQHGAAPCGRQGRLGRLDAIRRHRRGHGDPRSL